MKYFPDYRFDLQRHLILNDYTLGMVAQHRVLSSFYTVCKFYQHFTGDYEYPLDFNGKTNEESGKLLLDFVTFGIYFILNKAAKDSIDALLLHKFTTFLEENADEKIYITQLPEVKQA